MGGIGRAQADDIAVRMGGIGVARGERISVELGGDRPRRRRSEVSVTQGFARTVLARDVHIRQGGAQVGRGCKRHLRGARAALSC